MKKMSLFVLMMIFAASAHAAETRMAEPAVIAMDAVSADPFGKSMEGEGVLMPKPGELFSEGTEEAGTELPYLISQPAPIKYPRWAVRQGWEGQFSLAIEILKDGTVGRYQVMQSTGHKLLDEAATEAVRTWKFQPARKDGKTIVTCIQVPVTFQLRKD